jgi:hypothetical protein
MSLERHARQAHGLTTTINGGWQLPDRELYFRHKGDHDVHEWAHEVGDLYTWTDETEVYRDDAPELA